MPMPAYMPGCDFHKRTNDKHCNCQAHRVRKAKTIASNIKAIANILESAARGNSYAINKVKNHIDNYWHGLVFFEGEVESIFPPE